MIINHNMSAINANRVLGNKTMDLTKNMEKLSSGQRINRAADDASGLAVSEKMRSQIRGLNQAERNIQNGVSFIQTTEGYLQETQDILHRLRELSVQSANGVYSSEDRMQIQVEVSQLIDEVNRIASHAEFNGELLLDGRFGDENVVAKNNVEKRDGLVLHVGANADQSEKIYIGRMDAEALGLQGEQGVTDTLSIATPEQANQALLSIDKAMTSVNKQRADLGAYQNRFEMAAKGVAIASENLTASESRIRDADMASEMVEYTKNQILTQASTAMLAQANVRSQSVMQLLG
jgi:flagellin